MRTISSPRGTFQHRPSWPQSTDRESDKQRSITVPKSINNDASDKGIDPPRGSIRKVGSLPPSLDYSQKRLHGDVVPKGSVRDRIKMFSGSGGDINQRPLLQKSSPATPPTQLRHPEKTAKMISGTTTNSSESDKTPIVAKETSPILAMTEINSDTEKCCEKSEEENIAAVITIQTSVRIALAKKRAREQRECRAALELQWEKRRQSATIKIQAFIRAVLAKRRAREQRECRVALELQLEKRRQSATINIQAFIRAVLAKKRARERRECRAALELQWEKRRQSATIKIQAFIRASLTRIRVFNMIEHLLEDMMDRRTMKDAAHEAEENDQEVFDQKGQHSDHSIPTESQQCNHKPVQHTPQIQNSIKSVFSRDESAASKENSSSEANILAITDDTIESVPQCRAKSSIRRGFDVAPENKKNVLVKSHSSGEISGVETRKVVDRPFNECESKTEERSDFRKTSSASPMRGAIMRYSLMLNGLCILTGAFCCLSLSGSNYQLLQVASMAETELFPQPTTYVAYANEMKVGLFAMTVNIPILEMQEVIRFDEFCDAVNQPNGLRRFLQSPTEKTCQYCEDARPIMMIGLIVGVTCSVLAMTIQYGRLYERADINCSKLGLVSLELASLAGFVLTWYNFIYACLEPTFYDGTVGYAENGQVVDAYSSDKTAQVNFDWSAGNAMICLYAAFALKVISLLCDCCTPSVSGASTKAEASGFQRSLESPFGYTHARADIETGSSDRDISISSNQ